MGISSNPAGIQNQLPLSENWPDEPSELSERLYDVYQNIANAVNSKIGGLYVPQEKITSGQYFDSTNVQVLKNVYRMVVDFGALPAAVPKSVAHGITVTSSFRLTNMYAAATDPINLIAIPIPFASPTLNLNISLSMDSTFVTITVGSDYSTYTACTVVIEYTKG